MSWFFSMDYLTSVIFLQIYHQLLQNLSYLGFAEPEAAMQLSGNLHHIHQH